MVEKKNWKRKRKKSIQKVRKSAEEKKQEKVYNIE